MDTPSSPHLRPLIPLILLMLAIAVTAFVLLPPGLVRYRELELVPPFEAAGSGLAFQAAVPRELPQDHNGTVVNSRARLLEDGRALGPAHATVSEVEESGGGAFAHVREGLWFSSSDGSDPNVNGRRYQLQVPVALPAMVHLGAVVVLQMLAAFVVSRLTAGRTGWRRWLGPSLQLALALAAVQAACWVLVENGLVERGELDEALYRQAFGDARAAGLAAPEFRFAPHHYLNYALNSEQLRDGTAQHNAVYRIRRAEPLRPREEVALRILALGGSTTYDNALLREEETWVFQLERRLRAELGPRVEVINGGVGGYTVYENFLHYVTHLTYLEPDLLLLFAGINDVNPRMFGQLALDYSNYRIPWRGSGDLLPPPVPWLAPFYPYRYYYLHQVVLPARARAIGRETHRTYPMPEEWPAALERNGPELYGKILENLVLLARAQGREVVILPQYFTPRRGRDRTFARGVDQHNEVGRQIAARYGLPFGAALLAPGAFQPTDTVDSCHFSARGAARMAELVYDLLRTSGALRSPSPPPTP